MTVLQLQEYLKQFNPYAVVKVFNGDTEQLETVTGFLFDDEEVEICSDNMGG